jgi:LacI family transcriptional regulator
MKRGIEKRHVRVSPAEAPQTPSRVTIGDIAAATNLSKATVSLVLRGSSAIPPATHARVQAAASRLGYVYNRGAASLRSATTNTVGIVVNDVTNPYFAEIVAALQRRLTAAGRFCFLCNTGEDTDLQARFVETLREHRVDGIILCPADGTDAGWLDRVRQTGKPLILLSRFIDAGLDCVGPDNAGGMRLAMEHLIAGGHTRIALVGANERNSTGSERLEGYCRGLAAARLAIVPELIVRGPPTRDEGFRAAVGLMALAEPPTAIACFNDVLAFGVMLGLRSLGLAPGAHVSVIGFDDVAEAALWRPALTTVAIPREALAEEASRRLLARIGLEREAPPARILLPASLVVRATTARVPSGH